MQVEVDQSGKIGNSRQDVVLALAGGGVEFTLLVSARVQRGCLESLRRQHGKLSKKVYSQLFAVALYFLLRKHIEQIDLALIDTEYPGQEAQIKEHLYNLFRRSRIYPLGGQIQFGYVTKKSPAHELALETFRGNRSVDLVLTAEMILGEF